MTWAESLDDLPKPAWIGLMILGFIAFWPIGLAILAYLIWSGKMGCWKRGEFRHWKHDYGRFRTTGNAAFDEYREETLKRLEDEQKEFTSFLDRLRRAKGQAEFDQFMAERNGSAKPESGPMPQEG